MEVSKEDFEHLELVLGVTSSVPNQEQILDEIGFHLGSDCDNYIGKYFPDEEWKNPDPDSIYEFFEKTIEDYELRHKKFLRSPILSLEELERFRELKKVEYEENEGYPSTWTGSIQFEDFELVVFVSRWNDDDNKLLGVFHTRDQGELTLFSDGEIL